MEKKGTGNRRLPKKQLMILADDFGLLEAPGVRRMINESTDYNKTHAELMKIYNNTYCR